jgi:hypothetical protein
MTETKIFENYCWEKFNIYHVVDFLLEPGLYHMDLEDALLFVKALSEFVQDDVDIDLVRLGYVK